MTGWGGVTISPDFKRLVSCLFRKQLVFRSKHLLTCCTLRLGASGRDTGPARAPTPSRPTCCWLTRCPRLGDRPRAPGAARGRAFKDGRGPGRVPRTERRPCELIERGRGARGARAPPNQRRPLGPPSLKRSPFREITSARPRAPLSPFSLYLGAAREGAAPRIAGDGGGGRVGG